MGGGPRKRLSVHPPHSPHRSHHPEGPFVHLSIHLPAGKRAQCSLPVRSPWLALQVSSLPARAQGEGGTANCWGELAAFAPEQDKSAFITIILTGREAEMEQSLAGVGARAPGVQRSLGSIWGPFCLTQPHVQGLLRSLAESCKQLGYPP